MKKRKRQIHSHQRENHHHEKNKFLKDTTKNNIVTLEELILASPRSNKQSSNKVYPSLGGLLCHDNSSNTINCGTSEVVDGIRDQKEDNYSTICRSQSGKLKKTVSFRLPEVADVFILDH